jgi:two-component system copper resistance phosphate regulon response regulator CusR
MSKRELELMELFLKNPQKVLSRDFIKGEIWGESEEGKSNIVDVYILYLRKRLRPYGLEKSIKTYPQVGYILDIA